MKRETSKLHDTAAEMIENHVKHHPRDARMYGAKAESPMRLRAIDSFAVGFALTALRVIYLGRWKSPQVRMQIRECRAALGDLSEMMVQEVRRRDWKR